MSTKSISVIAIDGPTASGKGTVAQMVATQLGFHYLDSGALYRLATYSALHAGIDLEDQTEVASLALSMKIVFTGEQILLGGENVTEAIRTEPVSQGASRVAAHPPVREALLALQRAFAKAPGLVADGRDMGSVVFPSAALKVFLTASPEARAVRRTNQLISKGLTAKLQDVLQELQVRDARDSNRPIAPLKHYPDAKLLVTDNLSAEQAARQIVEWFQSV